MQTYNFRDTTVEGDVLISPDTPVVISKTHGKELALTIRKSTGKADDENPRQP